MNKKAFTLVELIVVITILSILGTIAFISLQGYSRNARDSTRVSDVSSIVTSMLLYETTTNTFPDPTGGINITYSGATLWNQGTLGDSVITNLDRLSIKPKDPLTLGEYSYSITQSKREFEIGAILEGGFSHNLQHSKTANAADALKTATSYVKGNYNGEIAKTSTGSKTYILAVPTIISGDMTITDIIDIYNSGSLAYNGSTNIPNSYNGSNFIMKDGGTVGITNPVVFEGDLKQLYEEEYTRIKMIQNLKQVYQSTHINTGNISELIDSDISILDSKTRNYIDGKVDRAIKLDKKLEKQDIFPLTCGEQSGTFEGFNTGDIISESCLYSSQGDGWEVDATGGNGGGKAIKSIGSESNNYFIYEVTLLEPAKLNFDFKTNTQYVYFYINDIEMIHLGGSLYKTYTTPLLPPGEYTFKWRTMRWGGFPTFWIDNVLFSCVGGPKKHPGQGCGITDFNTENTFESGDSLPWEVFNYITPAGNIPWIPVTGTGNTSEGDYAIKSPYGYSKSQFKFTKIITEPTQFSYDYKTNGDGSSYMTLMVDNGVTNTEYHRINHETVYTNYTSPILPPGTYTFHWRGYRWGGFPIYWLDNMKFIPQ